MTERWKRGRREVEVGERWDRGGREMGERCGRGESKVKCEREVGQRWDRGGREMGEGWYRCGREVEEVGRGKRLD
jgi:hypothetical protein